MPHTSSPKQHTRWSWTIGRIAGIDIEVHATFLLLLAWVAWAQYRSEGTTAAAISGVIFMLAVFGSVVLHELGHALTAAHYGVHTRSILLLPIGGVAQLEQIPDEPLHELAIAIAGPLVTIAIAVILYIVLRLTGTPLDIRSVMSGNGSFIERLLWINIVLAAFNLLPAFPMDGGRVLRAAIATRIDHTRATVIAARVGQAFALAFGLIGLFVTGDLFLVLIAFFVWLAAASEARATRLKTALDGIPVSQVMITDVRTLSSHDPLSIAIDHVMAGFQHDFPVVDDHTVIGILTRADLLRALGASQPPNATVGDVMQRSFASTTPNEMLDAALTRLQQCRCQTLPVLRDGQLAGVLTMESIGELVAFESAARGTRERLQSSGVATSR